MSDKNLNSIDTLRERLEALSIEELTELNEIEDELEQRDEMEAAKYYIPNGKAEEFIDLVGSDKHFVNMFIGANGTSKCIPLDTPILMADGNYKKLEDIKIGDYVLGHNWDTGVAEPSKVLETSRAGKKVIYKISFKDGSSIKASEEHSFPIKLRSGLSHGRKGFIKKRTIREILDRKYKYVGGKVKFLQPKNVIFNNETKLPIHPYLLGALLGDGTLKGYPSHGKIGFTNTNKEVIERVKILVEEMGCQLKQETNIDYRIVQYARTKEGYGKNILVDKIKELKLNVNSGDKFIPNIYKTASLEDRKQLLAGLIDTDGTYSSYTTKSKTLAQDFMFVARSIGGYVSLHPRVVNNNFTKFEDKIYQSVYWKFNYKLPLQIDKKQRLSKKPVDYSNRFMEKIEKLSEVECGDLFIEHPYHCYISNDFISTGNTATGANIVANIVFGPQSDWFKKPLFKQWPYIKKGRIISDPTSIKEKIIPELIKWLPRNSYKNFPEKLYETTKEGKYYASKFIFNNGWVIDIMSNEQDVKSFESVDLGFLWMDEPLSKKIFLASIARGRLGMICFWTYTPLFEAGWIKDWMDEHLASGLVAYTGAEAEDNCKIHGLRGFFEHKSIQRMADAYPEDEREARIFGKFGHLLGRVHKKFNRKIHVIPPFELNERTWTTYKALDPHPRVADHVLYMSVNSAGTKIISGEVISEGSIKLCHERMIELETKMHFRIEDRIIDPSAYNDDQHKTEKSVGSQLFDMGESWIKGSKNMMAGIKRTDSALDYVLKENTFIKEPEMYVFDTVPTFIKQMEEYTWAEYKGTSADDREKSGRPKDKNDHQPENLHRLLLHEPRFIPIQMRSNKAVKSSGSSSIADKDFDPY